MAIATRAGSGATTTYDPSTSPATATAAAAAAANVAIVFVNKVQNEGRDAADLSLPSNENDLVSAVAAANPNTVVVMNTSAAVLMPWLLQVKGVVEAWLGGEQGGNALASHAVRRRQPRRQAAGDVPGVDRAVADQHGGAVAG